MRRSDGDPSRYGSPAVSLKTCTGPSIRSVDSYDQKMGEGPKARHATGILVPRDAPSRRARARSVGAAAGRERVTIRRRCPSAIALGRPGALRKPRDIVEPVAGALRTSGGALSARPRSGASFPGRCESLPPEQPERSLPTHQGRRRKRGPKARRPEDGGAHVPERPVWRCLTPAGRADVGHPEAAEQ
jgi:hypothetical protein